MPILPGALPVAWSSNTGKELYRQGEGSTNYESRIAALEAEVARLENDKLNILDAIAVFSFAAYGNLRAPANTPFSDLGAAWQKVDILTDPPTIPERGITIDPVNSTFSFAYDGKYRLSVTGSFEHNSTNQGRTTQFRVYNETKLEGGTGTIVGTGRNAEASPINASLLLYVTEENKGDIFRIEVGNGDTYTAVSFFNLAIDINAVGEWEEPLGIVPGP